jgi:uncharacterized protein YdaL
MNMTHLLKNLRLGLLAILLTALASVAYAQKGGGGGGGGGGGKPKPPATTSPAVLVLYDEVVGSEYQKLGQAYAIMLRNLLGHFDAQVEMKPVAQYTAGQIGAKAATFYIGSAYDHPLPTAFLTDAAQAAKPVVWFKYNLWQLTGNATYNFAALRGFTHQGLRGLNAVPTASDPEPGFFDTITYKSMAFRKFYAYDANTNATTADPDVGSVSVLDATKASVVVPMSNPKANGGAGETLPYVVRSGNFWYVADAPFSFIGPRDRYVVLTDLLHDMLGIAHAESHQAMVRLEDVGALVNPDTMKTLSDYLKLQNIPFSIAVIPRFMDPLGVYNNGTPQDIRLPQATNLRNSLNYALARGAEIVAHGYTHQYSNIRNPHTGVSGDDYEFWNIVTRSPVAEDSTAWATDRLSAVNTELRASNYPPVAWESPHYHASPLTSRAVPKIYPTTYQRVVYFTADKPDFNAPVAKDFEVGQVYPYPIKLDYYGQRVLPENLGNIEYDISQVDPTSNYNYTWQDLYTNAQYARTVRDGYASFFFHPFWLEPSLSTTGFEDFKKLVEGITALGFRWTSPTKIAP